MKLDQEQRVKIDPKLRRALELPEQDRVLRAVMLLAPMDQPAAAQDERAALNPSDFPSRQAYREHLIALRQNSVAQDLARIIKKLSDLSLDVRGGKVGYTVVVQGTASKIAVSLKLPAVRHASLDQPIELIRSGDRIINGV